MRWQEHLPWLAGSFLIGSLVYVSVGWYTRPLVPAVACQKPNIDFGKVEAGRALTHSFIIENRGTAPLQIIKVTADCGCTVAKMEQKRLEPGKSTNLKVSWSTLGMSGRPTRNILVETDDPAHKHLTLSVAADIVRPQG